MKRLLLSASLLALVGAATPASALTREEALVKARSYAMHKWRASQANTTASCKASYVSAFTPGDYVGVAYDWGGYFTLAQFDAQIAAGQGAGSPAQGDILACTTGVDCSGFVSQVWGVGHNTTTSIHDSATLAPQIQVANMMTGDVFNKRAYHVAMFTHLLASGEPAMIEAYGYNVNVNTTGGWSHVNGYIPRRYNGITGPQTTANPLGTTTNPIPIGAFPYTDARDTRQSPSSVLDACAIEPSKPQKGPEYVYVANITQPGTLTVSVQDDAATDIDVQIHEGMPAPHACKARHDSQAQLQVGCGTYYVVADTYGNSAASAGNYTLSATFTPSGQPCAAVPGPAPFNPKGKLGDACAYPGNQALPFCNANVGGEICIYSSSTSFCSVSCATNADCNGLPGGGGGGGCCEELAPGEKYCLTQNLCGKGGSVGTSGPDAGPDNGSSSGGSSSGGSSSGDSSGDGEDPTDPSGEGDPAGDGTENGAAPGSTTTTTTGCGVAAEGRSGWELAALAGVVSMVAARRRKRR